MTEWEACQLCSNARRGDVSVSLAEWIEPLAPAAPGGRPERFSSIARCRDRVACRQRVEAEGLRWELVDLERVGPLRGSPALPPAGDPPSGPASLVDEPPLTIEEWAT